MRRRAVVAALLGLYVAVSAAGTVLNAANAIDPGERLIVLIFLGYAVAGAVILLRARGNVVGALLLGMALLAGVGFLSEQYAIYGIVTRAGGLPFPEVATWLSLWTWVVMIVLFLPIIFLFPDGRLTSRRWRPVFAAVLAVMTLATLAFAFGQPSDTQRVELRNPFVVPVLIPLYEFVEGTFVIFLGAFALAVASLIARARRAVGAERQQLKWIGATTVYILGVLALGEFAAPEGLLPDLLWLSAISALPVAIAIAILRYRLYDIDVLINRTLVYGGLTAALGGAYVGSVLLLQTALRPFTSGSDIAVAVSTLAVVALFQPLRRRIQDWVDRRFYRSRYDAQRALDAFAGRLRDEVDLDDLERELVTVVADTVRPRHASLWLREERR
ncbi:MAG: hypothetical protein ACRDGT_05200 [Candidatus Limnocylindria bacterium]